MESPSFPRGPLDSLHPSSRGGYLRARNRMSAFFHGTSVITARAVGPFSRGRKPLRNAARQPIHIRLETQLLNTSAPVLRSPTSTRSLIDPSSSPANSVRPATSGTFERFSEILSPEPVHNPQTNSNTTAESVVPSAEGPVEHEQTNHRRVRQLKQRTKENCLSLIRDRAIRSKLINCAVSGFALALMLTIYLALAVSNKIQGQEFQVVLILLILIMTIFFCHSLVRLCMLALNRRKTGQGDRVPSRIGFSGFAQPDRPIRVFLARDEEYGHDEEVVGEEDEDKDQLHPPPPAYGLWRGSVRVDPNLLHWQRIERHSLPAATEQEEQEEPVQQQNRPPSYVSQHRADRAVTEDPRQSTSSHEEFAQRALADL